MAIKNYMESTYIFEHNSGVIGLIYHWQVSIVEHHCQTLRELPKLVEENDEHCLRNQPEKENFTF
jgi:hypothetical protein